MQCNRVLAIPDRRHWSLLLALLLVMVPALAIGHVLIEQTGRETAASPSIAASDSHAGGVDSTRGGLCHGLQFCALPRKHAPASTQRGPQQRERGATPRVTD